MECPPRHFYCLRCNVVVSITLEAASEVALHSGHPCRYTRIVA